MSKIQSSQFGVYDGDGNNGGLVRMFGTREVNGSILRDPITSVFGYRFQDEVERATLLNSVANPALVKVHDLPGGCLKSIEQISDGGEGVEYLLNEFEEAGERVTLAHCMDSEIESSASVRDWRALFGSRVDHVAVLNLRECRAGDFIYWKGYENALGERKHGKTREEFLADGGVEIEMPALHPRIRAKMNAENKTFGSALSSEEMDLQDKSNIKRFRAEFAKAIAPATALLGLDGLSRRSIWLVSHKGGVGKTMFGRALTDYVRSN